MTEYNKKNISITDQCYKYMIDNNIEKLNIYDFLDHIKLQLNISEEEYNLQMAYFYTDLNVDGRFVCLEDGNWMLKDKLSVEEVLDLTEPSISKFGIDEDLDMDLLEEDEVTDELDELINSEDDSEESDDDLYGFEDEIVSKYGMNRSEEEF